MKVTFLYFVRYLIIVYTDAKVSSTYLPKSFSHYSVVKLFSLISFKSTAFQLNFAFSYKSFKFFNILFNIFHFL